jgi:hypothetical protein
LVDGANVKAETAADAVFFADVRLGAGGEGFCFAVGADVVGVGLFDVAIAID